MGAVANLNLHFPRIDHFLAALRQGVLYVTCSKQSVLIGTGINVVIGIRDLTVIISVSSNKTL